MLLRSRGPMVVRIDTFATTALGRLSELSVWWIRLGIYPELIEPAHPEQNGRHERMHKTLKAETTRPPRGNLSAQQARFNGRGRDAGFPAPPAQIPACAANAPGSYLGFWRQGVLPARDERCGRGGATSPQAESFESRSFDASGCGDEAPDTSAGRPASEMPPASGCWSALRGRRSNLARQSATKLLVPGRDGDDDGASPP